jgi:hypothetical protein
MRRRRSDPLSAVPRWTYPQCGFIHTAADLVRSDNHNFQCKAYGKPFDSGRADKLAG